MANLEETGQAWLISTPTNRHAPAPDARTGPSG